MWCDKLPYLEYFFNVSMEVYCERVSGMHVTQSVQIVMNLWCKDKHTAYATTQFFPNKLKMLQPNKMQKRTRRNIIGRCSTCVQMTCRSLRLCLERQSYLLSLVSFSY